MPHLTPLHDFHTAAGARMVDFAGWDMPLVYRSIIEEHRHTRASISLFDVSHMGRLRFAGKDAAAALQRLATRRVDDLPRGRCRYALVCNPRGGVMDDVIIARDESDFGMVCNASNREKLLPHFQTVIKEQGLDCTITDHTFDTAMVAIQGPKVIDMLSDLLPIDVAGLKKWAFESTDIFGMKFTVYRSGYTGEDGVEIVFPARAAAMVVPMVAGQMDDPDNLIKPAGLGARDTLRIEAALPLYGHELTEAIDPISAGLGFAVSKDTDFIGADAVRRVQADGPSKPLIGLQLDSPRTARQGQAVLADGKPVGEITSGTNAPTLGKSIAMAFVDKAALDSEFTVDFKGTPLPAKRVEMPFYKRP